MFTASELLEKINSHITDLQFTRTPKGLYAPVEYVLSMGGKRIRPVLMLMAYNLYQEDVTRIYAPAIGIEVYHNYTLLHDDLMDRADRRRGKETVHKVWNDNTAILSGDAMLILAYQFMAECSPSFLKEVMDLFSLTAKRSSFNWKATPICIPKSYKRSASSTEAPPKRAPIRKLAANKIAVFRLIIS